MSLTIYLSKDNNLNFILTILLILLSSFFISSIDITGDISNYKYLYENINDGSAIGEFKNEPVILYLYSILNLMYLDFSSALFFQAIIINILLAIACYRLFGSAGLRYFALVMIYSQYIQLSLYLTRQSLSIVFFLLFISYKKNSLISLVKKSTLAFVSIFSHLFVLIYFLLYLCGRFKLNVKVILFVFFFLLFTPLNLDDVNKILTSLMDISPDLNRKLAFYLRNDEIDSVISLWSTLFIPLHITFILIIWDAIKSRSGYIKNQPMYFLFLMLYLLMLATRNYFILPTRLGLILITISPVFYFYIKNSCANLSVNELRAITLLFILFISLSYVKFIYANDNSSSNVTFLKSNALSSQLFSSGVLR